jgi:hypothetical protein
VPLKKPSEYFKKEISSVNNSVQELVHAPELNTFSDAFESFKNNLSKIEVLSDFSETLDSYRVNVERVNYLSEKVEDIQTDIKNLLKKEDLDRAMMSQLLVVEHSISDIQKKVDGINQKNLTEIRLDVSGLTKSVNEFLENDVPRYKKLIIDSELRTNNRYGELETNVNQTLEGIGEFVDKKYDELTRTLQGINEESLSSILEDFKQLDDAIILLKETEIPKYKGFIVETERKTENKLNQFQEQLDKTVNEISEQTNNKLDSFSKTIQNANEETVNGINDILNDFEHLKQNEIPKYKGFIVETERKTENKLNQFQEQLDKTVNSILEKINLVEGDKTNLIEIVTDKIEELKNLEKVVFEGLEISENYNNEISKKVSDLEIDIIRNQSHIKVQNENLEQIQENVRSAIDKLNFEEIEEQNYELGKKIKYLEEIFDKFNEEKILTENLLTEPPSVKNKDILTPLNKNFVTLEQLQEHYRLFINRIQQQLATIGGGGETRFEFLDDVDRNSVKQDGYVIQYSSSSGKFIGTPYVPGGGSGGGISQWITTSAGIHTTSNVGIGTTNPTSILTVVGDVNIVGVITATDINSSSDIRLKKNIRKFENTLEKIDDINGVTFEWKTTNSTSGGIIAQDLEKVFPDLVINSGEYKTVNYNGLIGVLVESIKELKSEVEYLKSKLK